jgi:hypothetical protein
MMLLPKKNQFVEMPGGRSQYMAHIRLASVARPDGVCSVGERDPAVWAKIDDHFYVRIETMHVAQLVVHRVGRKPDAIEADQPIGLHYNPIGLGYEQIISTNSQFRISANASARPYS